MTDCQSLHEPEAPQRRTAALALQPSARAFLLRTFSWGDLSILARNAGEVPVHKVEFGKMHCMRFRHSPQSESLSGRDDS